MVPAELHSARLLLRRWRPDDAAALQEALDASLPELQAWVPWVVAEPSELPLIRERLVKSERAFDAGEEYTYAVRDPRSGRVIGGAGLYPRIGPDALEIGYWVRTSFTGRGYATEAAELLTRVAFVEGNVGRVEIRVDPRNAASAAVPRKLGFRVAETMRDQRHSADAAPTDLTIWQMTRDEWRERATTA